MSYALYINGIYETVLTEIVDAQKKNNNLVCYLQPHSPYKINWKNSVLPTQQNPITLYISTTSSLPIVTYKAKIIEWENKNDIEKKRMELLNRHIKEYQPKEIDIYLTVDDEKRCVNLISVIELEKLQIPIPVINFIKLDDNLPLKPRTRSGGWSYVNVLPDWIESTKKSIIADDYEKNINVEINSSRKDSKDARQERLLKASKIPEPILKIQRGYNRNSDVIVTVLDRANGKCEKCNNNAPFIRASDKSPYLEVHHNIMLSQGGEDTVENAMAVCPNCHKELHYGIV